MINSVANVQTITPSFRAKKINNGDAYKIIDTISDKANELLHKDRPVAEKTERVMAESAGSVLKGIKAFSLKMFPGSTYLRDYATNIEYMKKVGIGKAEIREYMIRESFSHSIFFNIKEVYKQKIHDFIVKLFK